MRTSEGHHRLDKPLGDGQEGRIMRGLRDLFIEQLRIHELYADELQVHPTDLRALELISHHGRDPLTMGKLASLLRLSTGAVTGTVDRLEENKLVERVRDRDDRRRVLLRITERAEGVTAEFYAHYNERVRKVLEAFDTEEIEAGERLLGALSLALADE
jgi:DNA-binding MarR family transcriptional regulator